MNEGLSTPWKRLKVADNAGGFLSIYYSDFLSRIPVRAIASRLGDNKSDPNLETGTYGLFSTCSKAMRSSVVRDGAGHIFFCTNFAGERVIAGYYEIGWYMDTHFQPKDYALAASKIHFVKDPVKVSAVKASFGLKKPRLYEGLDAVQVRKLRALLDKQADQSALYVREIRRLEQINVSAAGFRYVNFRRTDPFDWKAGAQIIGKMAALKASPSSKNASVTGQWACEQCEHISVSGALLRVCPASSAIGTLKPYSSDD